MSKHWMFKRGLFLILITSVFLSNGCDFMSSMTGSGGKAGGNPEIEKAYEEYRNAVTNRDAEMLKGLITEDKASELAGPNASAMLDMIASLTPSSVEVTGVFTDGDAATITARGNSAGGPANGTVHLLRQNGSWRVYDEKWTVQLGAMSGGDADVPKPPKIKGGDDAPSFDPLPVTLMEPVAFPYTSGAGPFIKNGQRPKEYLRLTGHEDEVSDVAFTPDGGYIVSVSYGDFSVRLWDASVGTETAVIKFEDRPRSVEVTPDGSRAIVLDQLGNITFIPLNMGSFGTPETIRAGVGREGSLAISPNGRMLATASWDKIVTIWDIGEKIMVRKIDTPEPMRAVAFHPSLKALAATSSTNKFSVWDLSEGEGHTYTVSKVDPNSDVSSISFSPDGKYMATGHMDSSIVIYDAMKLKELHNYYVTSASTARVLFSPASDVLATSHYNEVGGIFFWNPENKQEQAALNAHPSATLALAFSPDGSTMASAGEDKTIRLWR